MKITFVSILLSILYWFVFSLVLFFLILFLGHFYRSFKAKLNTKDIYCLFVFSLIVDIILVIILYTIPMILGVKPDLIMDSWYMYVYAIFIIFLKLVLYAVIFTIIIQPVILLGLFLYEKFAEKHSEILAKMYVSVIISFVVVLILYLFPWVLGGLLVLIYF